MKRTAKNKLLKSTLAGALGAAAVGGAAYLLSNKKIRKKLGKFAKDIEKKGEEGIEKVLEDVQTARRKTEKRAKKAIRKIQSKKVKLS
ncbi:MAG: hypothetical protein UT39_C0022G0018 [Candidatus Woesebacteria bacterium GW2011_GWA1_39_21]|uniref:Uncharacterized protein n=1 Tax=Candidatus Woesebacteria bacterium GW2011_GWA1_39_21 TaxID=1618550 RepID=A0A0G0N1S4_9BACT|nr:MAG: hypothetical protein UT39_C0022G0018 [Candidatus Woesebacteria bacterium GW2011_GWA1_39_21]